MEYLNKIAEWSFPLKKSLKELEIERSYVVHNIRRIQTKFGPSIIIHINDGGEEYQVFLPNRIVAAMDEKHWEELCDRVQMMALSIIHLGYGRFRFE